VRERERERERERDNLHYFVHVERRLEQPFSFTEVPIILRFLCPEKSEKNLVRSRIKDEAKLLFALNS
jgi:hypothetical protein